jgi:hypothetical protein
VRKQTLLNTSALRGYRPSIRLGRHGHPMRDPEGHEGGGESNAGGDNQGGNSGNSGQSDGNAGNQGNNTGSQFDPGSFWNSPAEETPPNSGSAGSNQQGTQNQGGGGNENQGSAFADALNGLNFGNGVFTPEAVEKMNGGDATQFHQNMYNFGREVTRQAVIMAAQLMQQNNRQLEERFGQMVDGRFGQQHTEQDLAREIPSYTKPGMKPVVDGIMAQALKVTKNDRKAAIAMTKEMLKVQTQALASDFGISTPPGGAGNDFGTGQQTNWEEELLGRS